METQKTGFVYHPDYLNHDTGPNHPERPDRLRASLSALQESDIWKELHAIEPTPASTAQLRYVHKPTYPEHIKQHCEAEISAHLRYNCCEGFLRYSTAFNRWRTKCCKRSRNGNRPKRLRDGASPGTPRHTKSEHGVLSVQQHRHRCSLSPAGTRRRENRNCGLGCPSRQRHTRYFLRR